MQLGKKYPNSTLTMKMDGNAPPSVNISTGSMVGLLRLTVSNYVNIKGGKSVYVFRTNVVSNLGSVHSDTT